MAASPHWLDTLSWPHGRRALDVATGTGRLARSLAGRYQEVVGLDRAALIERAIAHPGITFVAGDAEALPFADDAFDLVAISWSLHHLANPTRVLEEMRRVLEPGGVLMIEEPVKVLQGDNRDLHVMAHDLLQRMDFARGVEHFPLYGRMHVGSVIQGLGLVDIHFHPILGDDAEATWDLAACQAAGRPFADKLQASLGDPALASFHDEARRVLQGLASEGMRTGPVMVTWGTLPAVGTRVTGS